MRRLVTLLTGSAIAVVAVLLATGVLSTGDAVAQDACDPSYPNVCIPPPPPDIDCADIAYRDFTVDGDDPHGFDEDADGIGCESATFGPGLGEPSSELPTATPGPTATPAARGIVSAGAGPGGAGGAGTWALVMAGFVGAGMAWLIAGTGAGLSRRRHAVERAAVSRFVPVMRPRGTRIEFDR